VRALKVKAEQICTAKIKSKTNKGDKNKPVHRSCIPYPHHQLVHHPATSSNTASRRVVKLQQATRTTERVLIARTRHEGISITSQRLGSTSSLDTIIAEALTSILETSILVLSLLAESNTIGDGHVSAGHRGGVEGSVVGPWVRQALLGVIFACAGDEGHGHVVWVLVYGHGAAAAVELAKVAVAPHVAC